MKLDFRYTFAFIAFFAVETLIAIFVHDSFIRPFIGDVLVIVLMYCFIRIFYHESKTWLPIALFIFASAVEIGQYFGFVKFLGLENNRIASIILGSVFNLRDILCYLAGAFLLLLWQRVFKI